MEKAMGLLEAIKALLVYLDEEHVYDKLADAGCGGIDPYRSEKFDALIRQANAAVLEFEKSYSSRDKTLQSTHL